MAANPKLLMLQEPTRGVDVGARVEMHRYPDQDRQTAVARCCSSPSDVEEAVAVSHRLLIMREGRDRRRALRRRQDAGARAIAFAAGEREAA